MLFLVATPIGNLDDITYRAVQALESVDLILCEDTRHSKRLLNHYQISKPLKSYHLHNEAGRMNEALNLLKQGKQIALISDAGTPGIADPGQRLVAACHKEGLPVSVLPGPCAAISALTMSGLSSDQFHFVGFLPKKGSPKQAVLLAALGGVGTTIAYESPQRILETLQALEQLDPHCRVGVARELTKQHESIVIGTPIELIEGVTLRGEMVLLIQGNPDRLNDWLTLPISDHVTHLMTDYGLSRMDAIKLAAQQRGVPKRTVYDDVHFTG